MDNSMQRSQRPTGVNRYTLQTGYEQIDIAAIHQYLSKESYWARNIPFETVDRAARNSFCVGVFDNKKQVAYARFVTDYATFAYLADVFVLDEHRGQGVSKMMMEYLSNLDWVQGLRRIMLATLDAHGLYAQYGFTAPKHPDRLMEITRPGMYGSV